MTQEDIIRMAVGAQLITIASKDGVYMKALERFAALVRADEREACAALVQSNAEACDTYSMARIVLDGNAAAIRARGQA
jgi:hypothetical protein